MSNKAEKTLLSKTTCKTQVKETGKLALTSDINSFIAEKLQQPAKAVVWLDNKVVWGKYEAGSLELADDSQLEIDCLQELRIFNEDAELYIRKGRQSFMWRYVNDESGTETAEFVDCMSRLWGEVNNTAAVKQGYTNLIDKARKLSLVIPVTGTGVKYYGLVTRNYIEYDNQTGQAGYGDYRYVMIKDAGRAE